jgi:hypothetical protein
VFSSERAYAQAAPPVATGNLELGLFAGESYGLDRFRPMFGGNVAYGASRLLYPFVEGSYLPGLNRVFQSSNGSTSNYSINLTDFHGGVHFRIVKGNSRIVPYLVAGLGLVHSAGSQAELFRPGPNGPIDVGSSPIPSNTSFALNAGAGMRFFLTERIGIRLEFKAFVPTSAPTGVSNDAFYRFAIGPVFQLR